MHSARTVTIVELELIRRFRWMAAAVVLDCTDILLQNFFHWQYQFEIVPR